ncbi:hypothetical protein BOTBODRAFT_145876 [Botryobasidium botryosum FD-172 SS1]|uniref:F-box domain-containing protein n=1 Tax=Botryobasidium botryosum (strain FD-172 SS1) TaxID=930990 RepID=A0A067MDZ8_BOTB1|nr:hypothetical protein BOTBODRAFT_145876 [Botryobasidium botryosum FD-172 SS1]
MERSNSLLRLDRELDALARARDSVVEAVTNGIGDRLSKVKPLRNQFAPVYRLPDEILSYIFMLLHDSSDWSIGRTASHVSSVWRQVAVNTPRLWSGINKLNQLFVETCISRSKNAPLSIVICEPYLHPPSQMRKAACGAVAKRCVAALVPHSHRWERLSLRDLAWSDILPLFHAPAPRLKDLSLKFLADCPNDVLPSMSLRPFGGNSSQLRALHLADAPIPPSPSTLYPHLTSLWLGYAGDGNTPLYQSQLLDILKSTPYLEQLNLYEVTVSGSPGVIASPSIDLPKLGRVYTDSLDSWILRFILGSVYAPAIHTIEATSIFLGNDLASFFPLRERLERSIPSLLKFTSVEFEVLDYSDEEDFASVGIKGLVGQITLLAVDFYTQPGCIAHPIFCGLGRDLPLPLLTSLTITGLEDDRIDVSQIVDTLANLPTLQYLKFRKCSASFIDALVDIPIRTICPDFRSISHEHPY